MDVDAGSGGGADKVGKRRAATTVARFRRRRGEQTQWRCRPVGCVISTKFDGAMKVSETKDVPRGSMTRTVATPLNDPYCGTHTVICPFTEAKAENELSIPGNEYSFPLLYLKTKIKNRKKKKEEQNSQLEKKSSD
ncbi:hypothetical protein Scep_012120 [Stephania cephalantha]|uniref:Uncharacterized protein n=1 Tax=Stephania cephalantha TaxID=152367 RepID=A0AAP0P672_9MAGN